MLVFIISRIGNAIMVMLAVAMLAFLIFRLAGDPVELMANEQMTQADRDNLRERLGLNDSTATQFVRFVANAARGDFGISYRNGQDVLTLIAERFPATLELVLVATLLSLVVGIPLGVLTAIKRGKWYTEALQFISIVGVSLPSFVVGILLILVFSVILGWLPAFGRGEVVQIGWWSTGLLTPSGRAALILPAVTLSLYQITLVMRLVRAEMLEVLRSDFVKFARARGIPRWRIHFRHALRNCLMPVVTDDGHEGRHADRLRADHRDRVPVAGHGHALHPGGDLRRYPGDGRLSLHRLLHLRRAQHAGRHRLCGDRSAAARRTLTAGGRVDDNRHFETRRSSRSPPDARLRDSDIWWSFTHSRSAMSAAAAPCRADLDGRVRAL